MPLLGPLGTGPLLVGMPSSLAACLGMVKLRSALLALPAEELKLVLILLCTLSTCPAVKLSIPSAVAASWPCVLYDSSPMNPKLLPLLRTRVDPLTLDW
jgi:hypothetical protein